MHNSIIAFGDIHGCVKAAHKAIEIAEKKAQTACFLGDYVDRGKSSCGVLLALVQAKKRNPGSKFLIGNHDKILLDIINRKRDPHERDLCTYTETYTEYLAKAKK
jgi:serine/threonine protein phosphatase 1